MWPSDPILKEAFTLLFPKGLPFQCLPTRVERTDAGDPRSLRAGFERLIACPEAKQATNVVLIWALDNQYLHAEGSREPSTVVYIEKTDGSIFGRWSRYCADLATGRSGGEPTTSESLRGLATVDNLRFYTEVVGKHGPLRVWWADVARLNGASALRLPSPREWERLLLKTYRERYGCLPLKNRRG